jgi:hypothetical protein
MVDRRWESEEERQQAPDTNSSASKLESPADDSPVDEFVPNQASNKEQAEGPREIYALERDELAYAERRDLAQEDLEKQLRQDKGVGITNRPLEEEKKAQESLPSRGTRKAGV